jgi:membrane protease YdiL (CAAX protease family)
MLERMRKNQNKVILALCLILLLHYSLVTLFQFNILPSFPVTIGNLTLPAFQTTQVLLVLPIIILITYILFIRTNIIRWRNIGFYRGTNGLLFTIFLGLVGGLIQGTFDFFTINHFLLQSDILSNFIEKCIFAPLWEEFLYRVLVLTILEFAIINFFKTRYFDSPKYKDQFTESKKKWTIFELYILIIVLNAMMFVFLHGVFSSPWIFISGIIMATVYIKTRSIIAPIIVHSISNFVTGGFLFLLLHYFSI